MVCKKCFANMKYDGITVRGESCFFRWLYCTKCFKNTKDNPELETLPGWICADGKYCESK